jgi:hypothetical protein
MRPAYEILADDKRITDLIRDRLVSLNLTDESGFESDTFSMTIDNRGLKIAPPKAGAELKVSLGYIETGLRKMGLFVVDEYDRSGLPHQITIRAKSAWMGSGKNKSATVSGMETAMKAQRTRSWDFQTLETIVFDVAADCGLDPRVDPDLAGEVIGHVDQTNEGNANFLRRLAKERDAVFKPAGGKLIFAKRAKGKTISGVDVPRVYLDTGLVRRSGAGPWAVLSGEDNSYRITVAEREDYLSVAAYYHDVSAAERKKITAGEGEPQKELRGNYPTPEEAASAAAAELRRIGRGASQPTFNCEGEPILAAEGVLVVGDELGSDLAGDWLINRAVHTIDGSGYRTALECESAKET